MWLDAGRTDPEWDAMRGWIVSPCRRVTRRARARARARHVTTGPL